MSRAGKQAVCGILQVPQSWLQAGFQPAIRRAQLSRRDGMFFNPAVLLSSF
jgi:hypothetical protein